MTWHLEQLKAWCQQVKSMRGTVDLEIIWRQKVESSRAVSSENQTQTHTRMNQSNSTTCFRLQPLLLHHTEWLISMDQREVMRISSIATITRTNYSVFSIATNTKTRSSSLRKVETERQGASSLLKRTRELKQLRSRNSKSLTMRQMRTVLLASTVKAKGLLSPLRNPRRYNSLLTPMLTQSMNQWSRLEQVSRRKTKGIESVLLIGLPPVRPWRIW